MPKLTAQARAKFLTQIKGTDQYEVEREWMQEFHDAMEKVIDDSDDFGEKEKDIQKMQDELLDVMFRSKEHDPKTRIKYNAEEVEEKLNSFDKVVADFRKKYGDKDFPEFFKKYDEQGVGYDLGDKEESKEQISEKPEKTDKKEPVIASETKPAVSKQANEWIREIQNKVGETQYITPEEFARIIACRQLADTERGHKSRLVNTTLTEEQIDKRAAELLSSKAFDDYINKRLPKISLNHVTDGHGGRLEDDMTEFIRAREDCQDLDPKLFGRYQFKTPYKTYDDYINDKKRVPGGMNLEYLDNSFEYEDDKTRAAKLMAAATIKNMKPNSKFNPEILNEKARELIKSPIFKLATKNKNALDSALKGDFNAYADEVGRVQEMFSKTKSAATYGRMNIASHIDTMKGVKTSDKRDPNKAFIGDAKDVETENKYLSKRSQKYQRMVRNAEKLIDNPNASAKDTMKAVNAILEYQNGKEGGSLFKARNQRFDQSMQLLADITIGTPAQKYLEDQIKKVNTARGKQPGDAGYYSIDTLRDNAFKSVKTGNELENKVNEVGDIGLGGPMN